MKSQKIGKIIFQRNSRKYSPKKFFRQCPVRFQKGTTKHQKNEKNISKSSFKYSPKKFFR